MTALPVSVLRAAALVVLVSSVHACSDSGTGPGETELAGLAEVLSEASQPAIAGLGAFLPAGPVQVYSSSSAFSPGGCDYIAASQSFVCATLVSGGLTFERSFFLFDAAGNRQSEFVRGTTAAVRTKFHVAGTMTSAGGSLTIDNEDDRTVSGLLTARHVLNGTSNSTMVGTFSTPGDATSTPVRSTTAATIENLVLPSKERRWPGPGVMTMNSTYSWGGLPPSTSIMRAVFNGTKCVAITISSSFNSHAMTIDLADPGARCTP